MDAGFKNSTLSVRKARLPKKNLKIELTIILSINIGLFPDLL